MNKNWEPEDAYCDSDNHYWCEKCKKKNKVNATIEYSYAIGSEDVFRFCEGCNKLLLTQLVDWEDLDEQIKGWINLPIKTQEDFWVRNYLKELKEEYETNNT